MPWDFHLNPMAREDVDEWLDRQFTAIVPELKDVCYRRGGGYPLLLQSLCDWLHAVGAIAPETGRWRIVTSPTEFRRRLTVQPARYASQERSDQILLDRLRSIDFDNCTVGLPRPFTDAYLVLGLFALAETPERMAALTEMLELGDTGQRLAAVLETETLRDPAAPRGELRFRHDRYREAAVELARAAGDEALGALLRALPPGDRLQRVSLELLGDVQELAGQRERAWAQYQRGMQAAEEADAYLDVCRIAAKQEELLERSPGRFPVADYLRMLIARAWAEWNCGSMRTSRNTYERVIRAATSASDVSLDSTVARTFVAHASWRLVGINLELADSRAFVESAVTALGDVVSAGDYNAVMNRLVLYCGRFGLPELGLSFIPFSLAQAPANSEYLPPDFPGDGAVICADVGRLFLDSMPERALTIFRTGEHRSTSRRQRLWAAIDVLLADYLVTRELDSGRCDALRDEAVRMGLYAFLVRLDLLRSANALSSGNLREAERLLSRARERIAVQEQPCYEIAVANNAVISALLSGDNALTVRRMRELVRCVQDGVDGRERAWPELAGPIRELVVARWKRYEPSPLSIPVPEETPPPLCSSLMRAWFNLREVARGGDAELAAIAAPIAHRLPSALDLTAAQLAFDRAAERCGVSGNGTVLALCVE
jgi:tetratricopeptide (TPR) repeat protein